MTFFLPRKSWREIFFKSLPSKYCSVKSGATLPTFSAVPVGLGGASAKAAELASISRRVAANACLRIDHLDFEIGLGEPGPPSYAPLLWKVNGPCRPRVLVRKCGSGVPAQGRCRAVHCARPVFSVHC